MESVTNQNRNTSIAGTSPRPSSRIRLLAVSKKIYLYQPTVLFSDGNGIKPAVSTNPEHETLSLPISNNAALYENNNRRFLIQL